MSLVQLCRASVKPQGDTLYVGVHPARFSVWAQEPADKGRRLVGQYIDKEIYHLTRRGIFRAGEAKRIQRGQKYQFLRAFTEMYGALKEHEALLGRRLQPLILILPHFEGKRHYKNYLENTLGGREVPFIQTRDEIDARCNEGQLSSIIEESRAQGKKRVALFGTLQTIEPLYRSLQEHGVDVYVDVDSAVTHPRIPQVDEQVHTNYDRLARELVAGVLGRLISVPDISSLSEKSELVQLALLRGYDALTTFVDQLKAAKIESVEAKLQAAS